MSELKTLKDCYMSDGRNYEQILKEEAIKWIKDDTHCSNINPCAECKGLINGFKTFFNITKEDLK